MEAWTVFSFLLLYTVLNAEQGLCQNMSCFSRDVIEVSSYYNYRNFPTIRVKCAPGLVCYKISDSMRDDGRRYILEKKGCGPRDICKGDTYRYAQSCDTCDDADFCNHVGYPTIHCFCIVLVFIVHTLLFYR